MQIWALVVVVRVKVLGATASWAYGGVKINHHTSPSKTRGAAGTVVVIVGAHLPPGGKK